MCGDFDQGDLDLTMLLGSVTTATDAPEAQADAPASVPAARPWTAGTPTTAIAGGGEGDVEGWWDSANGNGDEGSDRRAVVAGSVCGAVVFMLGAVLLIYLCWRKARKARAMEFFHRNTTIGFGNNHINIANDNNACVGRSPASVVAPDSLKCSPGSSQSKEVQVFTYKQLHFATEKFNSDNIIGNGGFGPVYKGTLTDGTACAIKGLDPGSKQGEREFRVEVDLLSRLHSPYLLQLLGYCADQSHRLLVYEYMPNGSLQEHIYTDGLAGNPPTLEWGKRLKIALDAATGLEFLHEGTSPPIIHRDFKTSNILLDKYYNAKVSDFGLAKLGSEKVNGHVSTRVLGTTGYVAPEYAMTGHLTVKSDVYSFGVVLLELITGRAPIDMKRPPGEGILVSWALPLLQDREKVTEIVDPALRGQYSKKELLQVASIAAMCVQTDPEYRPLMRNVVQALVPVARGFNLNQITATSTSSS